jgi:2'-5' RNA ligase
MERRVERREGRAGIRCFVAVDLAADVLAEIETVVGAMKQVGGDVRWVAIKNLHVTLKFLGEIPEARVDAVRAALLRCATLRAPFEVTAKGLGAFPNPRRARVVWVGLSAPGLTDLAGEVDDALAGEGFPREARAVIPHITIGRVRSPRGWERVLATMQSYWENSFGKSRVDEIVLYRSKLGPDGPRYTALERLPLAQSAG